MKKILLILLLCSSIFAAQKPHDLLNDISKHSIDIGTGKTNEVYVFVDPLCKYSKKFITKISENRMLQLINTYHIFLYELPKLKSSKHIQHIYQSKDKKEVLLSIMVDEEDVDISELVIDSNQTQVIEKISLVAESLKIKRRPYMIVYEGDTGYCRVSEGEAPCMEEFDFE